MKIDWKALAALTGVGLASAAVSAAAHHPPWWGLLVGAVAGAFFTLAGHPVVRRSR